MHVHPGAVSVQVERMISIVQVVLWCTGAQVRQRDRQIWTSTRTTRKSTTWIESAVTNSWSPVPKPTPSGANPVGFWCSANNVDVPFKGSQLVSFMNPRNCPSGVD